VEALQADDGEEVVDQEKHDDGRRQPGDNSIKLSRQFTSCRKQTKLEAGANHAIVCKL
jgi:hypothetical protein